MEKSEDKQKKLDKNSNNFWKYGSVLVLAVLVSVGIYFFSNGENNNGNISGNVIASINGQEITSDEVAMIQQSFLQQGQQVSEEEALEQVINQEVLSQKVQQEGIVVTTEEAESVIEQQLTMQGATLDDFKQQVESQGASYEDEIENIKNQIATQNYLESALEGQNFEVKEEEAKGFYEMNKQQIPENVTYEEVESQIIMLLQQQKQQEAISVLIQELRASANVEYLEETGLGLEEKLSQEIPIEIQE